MRSTLALLLTVAIFSSAAVNSQIPDCIEYDAEGNCIQCTNGTILAEGGRKCSPCGNGCKTCDPANPKICLSCPTGKYVTAQKTCDFCAAGCSECSSERNCTKCIKTLYLNNSSCDACPLGCSECTSDSVCITCYDGYTQSGSKCTMRYMPSPYYPSPNPTPYYPSYPSYNNKSSDGMQYVAILAFASFVICGVVMVRKCSTPESLKLPTDANSSFIGNNDGLFQPTYGDNYMSANQMTYMNQPANNANHNPFGQNKF